MRDRERPRQQEADRKEKLERDSEIERDRLRQDGENSRREGQRTGTKESPGWRAVGQSLGRARDRMGRRWRSRDAPLSRSGGPAAALTCLAWPAAPGVSTALPLLCPPPWRPWPRLGPRGALPPPCAPLAAVRSLAALLAGAAGAGPEPDRAGGAHGERPLWALPLSATQQVSPTFLPASFGGRGRWRAAGESCESEGSTATGLWTRAPPSLTSRAPTPTLSTGLPHTNSHVHTPTHLVTSSGAQLPSLTCSVTWSPQCQWPGQAAIRRGIPLQDAWVCVEGLVRIEASPLALTTPALPTRCPQLQHAAVCTHACTRWWTPKDALTHTQRSLS